MTDLPSVCEKLDALIALMSLPGLCARLDEVSGKLDRLDEIIERLPPRIYFNARGSMELPNDGVYRSIDFINPYGPAETTWSFPVTAPAGHRACVTDLFFQDKALCDYSAGVSQVVLESYPHPNGIVGQTKAHGTITTTGRRHRQNGLSIVGGYTVTTDNKHIHFVSPLVYPAGFPITGTVVNNGPETMFVVFGMNGYLEAV
jgi:hypothetical protein